MYSVLKWPGEIVLSLPTHPVILTLLMLLFEVWRCPHYSFRHPSPSTASGLSLPTYVPTYLPTYLPYIPTYLRTYPISLPMSLPAYVPTYVHTYIYIRIYIMEYGSTPYVGLTRKKHGRHTLDPYFVFV